MGQPDHLDMSDLNEAQRAKVVDLVERMRARNLTSGGEPGAVAWLDGCEAEELTPAEAAELERRKADDRAGAPRWTLEELGL